MRSTPLLFSGLLLTATLAAAEPQILLPQSGLANGTLKLSAHTDADPLNPTAAQAALWLKAEGDWKFTLELYTFDANREPKQVNVPGWPKVIDVQWPKPSASNKHIRQPPTCDATNSPSAIDFDSNPEAVRPPVGPSN